ncbi:MAG: GNAT family N-acetyltransferase [Nakamurella sp.]
MNEVVLQSMTPHELAAFRQVQLDAYITQRVEFGGENRAEATRIATEQHARFFPDGRPADGHRLFTGRTHDGTRIGILWLFRKSDSSVWIYDIEVDLPFRGRGLGRGLMLAAHGWADSQGATVVELNVFGGNAVARRLYASLGYTESSVHMARHLRES